MGEAAPQHGGGPPDAAVLRLDAGVGRLAEVRRFVRARARGLGADEETVADLVQAVDEWVCNVTLHGYGGGSGPVEVEIDADGDGIIARVRDAAPPFDPSSVAPFDPTVPLEWRRPGGMGIHLIRAISDRFTHR